MPRTAASDRLRRLAAETALLVGVGVGMAFLGPYGTGERSLSVRLVYWLALILGGGVIGISLDSLFRRRLTAFWPRLLAASLGMTPFVTGLVLAVSRAMFGQIYIPNLFGLGFEVFIISFAVMALRQLALSRMEAAPVAAAPAPEDPTAAFRQRLSAKRRAAVIHAVEAEDHYLRVHTDAGDELITARFADALAELAAAPGFQTHRSWWVAADAIDAVTWARGRGEAKLVNGLTVPISRSNAAPLKTAGWF